MLNDRVRNTKHFYFRRIMMSCKELQYSTAKSTNYSTIFNRDYLMEPLTDLVQHFFIQWLGKTHIVMSRGDTIFNQEFAGCYRKVARMPECQDRNFFTITDLAACSNLYFLERSAPFR